MKKKLKLFLIFFVSAMFFWFGINLLEKNLESVFYWEEMTGNPRILAAQLNQQKFERHIRELTPLRNKNIELLELEAKSAASIFLNNQEGEKILFEKNLGVRLPIASLTKLMTAKVVLENYDLSKEIEISEEAIAQEEDFGKLEAGKVLSVRYLLYPLLMESSNDAAFALANDYKDMTEEKFVQLMNKEAEKLNLRNTYFLNSTGLDPEEPIREINYSTAADLAKLVKELLKEPLIWEILSTPKYNTYGPELINTNQLLGEIPGIVGGKTGYTEKALGCFLLVTEAPKGKGYLINVILGSANRFDQMEELVNWTKTAYKW